MPNHSGLKTIPRTNDQFSNRTMDRDYGSGHSPARRVIGLIMLLLRFIVSLAFGTTGVMGGLLPTEFAHLGIFGRVDNSNVSKLYKTSSHNQTIQ